MYTRESFKLYNERKNNDEGKQLRVRSGNNRRVTQPAHYFNEYSLKTEKKIKKNEPYLRGASPIVLFSFPLCHYYVSLLSSHDVLLRVTINSAEKLESFFDAMITHVAEEGYFLSALTKP